MLDSITFQALTDIRERSMLRATVAFNDSAAYAKVQPANVYWRLDDDASGVELQAWTNVAAPVLPVNTVTIDLSATLNRIVNESRAIERKTLTVMTDRGLATQFVASYGYAVHNLGWLS